MIRKSTTIAIAIAAVVGLIATSAMAVPNIIYDDVPLTQAELDANWVTDRSVPSGGYESVSFEGRDNVLEMRVDPDNRNETGSSFFYTEGLQRQTPGAAALKMDLYVDPSWEGQDVRAGLWGAGHVSGDRNEVFPIVEYHQDTTLGEAGWRYWDSETGWVPHPGTTSYGEWATVEIVLDTETNEFTFSVDGVTTTHSAFGTETLGEVIVNMFNYGPGTPAYDVHFSDFAIGQLGPDSKDDCKNGGYADFGFKNQGQCIKSVVASN